ncbi:DUF488 family protein [Carnobacterium maltaromaticum]|uniref:DUF488 domain-containing protein n=1 Tax=Carnobacterium maltaromaticum TaxID=2751 RepID=UPI0039AEA3B3
MNIYTIGFSKKKLENFIDLLKKNNVNLLIDTRLNNTSQLSGFSKRDDLQFILKTFSIVYTHRIDLAPTDEILKKYKKKEMAWPEYEKRYLELLKNREILVVFKELIKENNICFLCSESEAENCHRKLLVEYLKQNIDLNIEIIHL